MELLNVDELIGDEKIAITLTGRQWKDVLGVLIAALEFDAPIDPTIFPVIFSRVAGTLATKDLTSADKWPQEII